MEVDAHIELEKEKGQYLFVLGKTDEIQLNVTVVNLNGKLFLFEIIDVHDDLHDVNLLIYLRFCI